MNILDKIVVVKKQEVAARKLTSPMAKLEQSLYFERATVSLAEQLRKRPGLITEFKRKSPSKSEINMSASVAEIAKAYELNGSSAMSVLTDAPHFGGSETDLITARETVNLPILRKDFTIDEYQIYEAKSIGADLILLIAAILTPQEIKRFSDVAKSLGLEVLLEVHNEEELHRSLATNVDLVGVNNRNLKTFEVNIETSLSLAELIPDAFVKVSESGISDPETVVILGNAGYRGFLIGEHFMRQEDVGGACRNMLDFLIRGTQKAI
jgi:indole-3-glycerol phosphate synthase